MPGVGFGLGKERLLMLMELCGSHFGESPRPEILIAFIGDRAKHYALGLVQDLRKNHVRAAVDTQERNLKGQMKYSNKIGAKYSIVIGDDEIESGELTLKNMESGEQVRISKDDIVEAIRR